MVPHTESGSPQAVSFHRSCQRLLHEVLDTGRRTVKNRSGRASRVRYDATRSWYRERSERGGSWTCCRSDFGKYGLTLHRRARLVPFRDCRGGSTGARACEPRHGRFLGPLTMGWTLKGNGGSPDGLGPLRRSLIGSEWCREHRTTDERSGRPDGEVRGHFAYEGIQELRGSKRLRSHAPALAQVA